MADSAKVEAARARAAGLSSITTGVQPISVQEHSARVAKVQTAMQQRRIAALLVEAGSTLEYFTGIHWWRSERHLHGRIEAGMHRSEILSLLIAATEQLGGSHEFSLVLLNEASAYPHGSVKPQEVRKGSVILIDTGCSVHGYQSDISRSWVFGDVSPRQREIWDTVKRGQEIALETAKLGTAVGAIDRAVRAFYEQKSWSKDYGLPGLSHRTGHGIGMDVHEPPYLVRNDATALQAGMCFSHEPGIYLSRGLWIPLGGCWFLTEAAPNIFTPLAKP